MLRAPEAVPRIVFTNPAVSSTSIANAFPLPTPPHRRPKRADHVEHGPEEKQLLSFWFDCNLEGRITACRKKPKYKD
jgi:hypothetical protein